MTSSDSSLTAVLLDELLTSVAATFQTSGGFLGSFPSHSFLLDIGSVYVQFNGGMSGHCSVYGLVRLWHKNQFRSRVRKRRFGL